MSIKTKIILSISVALSVCLAAVGLCLTSKVVQNISGKVIYDTQDAVVLVQGKIEGVKTFDEKAIAADYVLTDIPTSFDDLTKINTDTQYLGFSEQDDVSGELSGLDSWQFSDIKFYQENGETKDIVVSLQFVNFDKNPLAVAVGFVDKNLQGVTRTTSGLSQDGTMFLAKAGKTDSIAEVVIKLSASKNVSKIAVDFDIIVGVQKVGFADNSPEKINEYNGIIKMGKTSADLTEDNIEWRCIAYSADGINYTRYIAGETVLTDENARYCYFVQNTILYTVSSQYYCKDSVIIDDVYYNANYVEQNVLANDYYYSDVRAFVKNEMTAKFNIDPKNKIYNAIVGRTIEDLYKQNLIKDFDNSQYGYKTIDDQILPTGADANETDIFWLLSMYEVQNYFDSTKNNETNDIDDRKFATATDSKWYWLRSGSGDNSHYASRVTKYGSLGCSYCEATDYPRVAFKLALA